MREIVVISGKGGTGKTSITGSFAYLEGEKVVVADCDVDAADMHLLLKPDFAEGEDFYSGEIAVINQDECLKCGKCSDICRYKAIPFEEDEYRINSLNCEGCGYCARICPVNAIIMEENNVGKWYKSVLKTGGKMIHAKMGIGAENSGKLVAKVKNEAKKYARENNKDIVLVDGSPGIGCPVISSLTGADYVVLVTEPTVSGLHDLKRVYEIVEKFGIRAGCIINKADLNLEKTKELKVFLAEKQIDYIADVPYDETFTEAMVQGVTIVEFADSKIKKILEESWEKIKAV